MKNSNLVVLIISLLFYSITALAYIHSSFVSRDSYKVLSDTVIRIESKLDNFILRDK